MNPKRLRSRTNYGMNSKKKSMNCLFNRLFVPFKHTPKVIYPTPSMTAIFILREFKKLSSFLLLYHFGSTPKG